MPRAPLPGSDAVVRLDPVAGGRRSGTPRTGASRRASRRTRSRSRRARRSGTREAVRPASAPAASAATPRRVERLVVAVAVVEEVEDRIAPARRTVVRRRRDDEDLVRRGQRLRRDAVSMRRPASAPRRTRPTARRIAASPYPPSRIRLHADLLPLHYARCPSSAACRANLESGSVGRRVSPAAPPRAAAPDDRPRGLPARRPADARRAARELASPDRRRRHGRQPHRLQPRAPRRRHAALPQSPDDRRQSRRAPAAAAFRGSIPRAASSRSTSSACGSTSPTRPRATWRS